MFHAVFEIQATKMTDYLFLRADVVMCLNTDVSDVIFNIVPCADLQR